MSRLEIVHLRTSAGRLPTLGRLIREAMAADQTGADGAGVANEELVTVFRRHGLDTDIAVHIHHHDGAGIRTSSELGLRLAAELRAFGLVQHSLWEELP